MAEKLIAEELAKKQQSISVSEFFTRNRHLLGFDNPRKALLTTIKEAVDNALDACEEAKVLPVIKVKIKKLSEKKFQITIEDNGPGIVKKQIPNIFASLLYGSKFFSMKQSRGQQGIGISAAVLYAQLTTGKPARITSKIDPKKPAHFYKLHIDTKTNTPEIVEEKEVKWDVKTGTKIELEIEAAYQKGSRSVDDYLKQTAIANPHISMVYDSPDKKRFIFPKAIQELPEEVTEIKPHPYGIELGIFIRMLKNTTSRTLSAFLAKDFTRVSSKTAKDVCNRAKIKPNTHPKELEREDSEKIFEELQNTKLMAPPTNCISPIGAENLQKSLEKEIPAEFYTSTTRPPSVYRGNPFQIEVALCYGGKLEQDKTIKLLRFANRVPLQYQQASCGITKSVSLTSWKNYGISQSRSSLPVAPMILVVHIASVWVPFTSESKESIAHYPEIIKEIRLAVQECGRKLGSHIRRTVRIREQKEKASLFENYIPEIASALSNITKTNKEELERGLNRILKKSLKELFPKENEK